MQVGFIDDMLILGLEVLVWVLGVFRLDLWVLGFPSGSLSLVFPGVCWVFGQLCLWASS